MNFAPFLNTVITLFFMLIVGFVAGKLNIVSSVASKNLSRLIITIGQPALIIYSLIRMEFTVDNMKLGLLTLGFCFLFHGFLAVLAFFAFLWIKNFDERKISEFAALFGNVGFIGIPILESLFGPTGAFMGAFFMAGFNMMVWTWGIAVMGRKRPDIKLTPKKVILNYGVVPALIGIFLFIMKGICITYLPEMPLKLLSAVGTPIQMCLSYMASLCTPVSMLIIGALLASRTAKQIFGSLKIYYLSLIKLLAFPFLVCVATWLFGMSDQWILFATTVAAMPCATTVTMLAELYDISPGYSAQAVGTTSLLSLATMPLMLMLANFLISLR